MKIKGLGSIKLFRLIKEIKAYKEEVEDEESLENN